MSRQVDQSGNDVFSFFEGKVVLVLGAGATGVSIVRWLTLNGATVVLADSRENLPGFGLLQKEFPEITVRPGPFSDKLFTGADLVVSSPGVPLAALPLEKLKNQDIPIVGDIEIFLRENINRFGAKVIAITGTNGKSTVTRMVEKILQSCGLDAIAVGNIGVPVLDVLTQISKEDRALPDVFVIEMSSFQIDTTYSFDFDAVTVLNISEDHLDRYPSFDAYVASKCRIYSGRGVRVVNRDDPMVYGAIPMLDSVVSFGLSRPTGHGEWGVDEVDGDLWLMCGKEKVCRSAELKVSGSHNVSNALAALALSSAVLVRREGLASGLLLYEGLDHRMQWIAGVEGVHFYNDSKATNVGATLAAISGLSTPCVLILGGESKQQNFALLIEAIREKIRAVVLIGKDAPLIRHALRDADAQICDAPSMIDAVRLSAEMAEYGDIILLSPGCASFDMFESYEHRGDMFVDAVRSLS